MGNKPSVSLKGGNAFLDMFKSTDLDKPKNETASTLPISCLIHSKVHPFKSYNEDKRQAMTDSIRQNGVLVPLIVRAMGDGRHEIIAGHNRAECARLAGLSEVPVLIMELDDDQAVLVMIESNLCQRENILPSERAWAYKLQMEAINRQGKRTDLTSRNDCEKLSCETIGSKSNVSARQVLYYIRLTHLIPELLDMVDDGKLPLTYAVDLSYLQESHQALVLSLMQDKAYKLTNETCAQLKKEAKDGGLTDDSIRKILLAKPPKPKKEIKIPYKSISKYNIPQNQVQEVIVKALDLYFTNQKSQNQSKQGGEI